MMESGANNLSQGKGSLQFEIVREPASQGAVVVRVTGEVDLASEERLRQTLLDATKEHEHRLVVDLSSCTFIDSTGIRALLVAHQEAQREGGPHFAIVTEAPQILRILSVTGIDDEIPVHATVDEASASN